MYFQERAVVEDLLSILFDVKEVYVRQWHGAYLVSSSKGFFRISLDSWLGRKNLHTLCFRIHEKMAWNKWENYDGPGLCPLSNKAVLDKQEKIRLIKEAQRMVWDENITVTTTTTTHATFRWDPAYTQDTIGTWTQIYTLGQNDMVWRAE